MGWGQPLGSLFATDCATMVDKARSGRSSKSFFDEGAWAPVKNALRAGAFGAAILLGRRNARLRQSALAQG
jgi:hypothetical protein